MNPMRSPLVRTPKIINRELHELRNSMRFNADGLASDLIFSCTPAVHPFISRLIPTRAKPIVDSSRAVWWGLYRNMTAPLTINRTRKYLWIGYDFPPTQKPKIMVGMGLRAEKRRWVSANWSKYLHSTFSNNLTWVGNKLKSGIWCYESHEIEYGSESEKPLRCLVRCLVMGHQNNYTCFQHIDNKPVSSSVQVQWNLPFASSE